MGLLLTQMLVIGGADVEAYSFSLSLANNQLAGDANLTVTTSDGSDYYIKWIDGSHSTVASGVEATHTYTSDYDGPVVIRSMSAITALSSTDGGWDFNVSALSDTITSLDFAFADVAITGAVSDLPSSLVTLDLAGSASVLTGDLGGFPSGLTSIDINGTGSTLTGDLADLPSTLAYLDMSSTSINITGDLADIPSTLAYVDLSDSTSVITATAGTVPLSSARAFYLQDTSMTQTSVDDVLAALATIATWVSEQAVNVAGDNATRSTESDGDVVTLEGNGVTVTSNENLPVYADTTWLGVGTSQADAGPITVDFPTHAADDLLCFGVVCRHDDVPVTPAGWTELTTPTVSGTTSLLVSIKFVVYYKIATGSGTTVTLSDFGNMHLSRGFALGNIDTTTPIDAFQVTVN